MKKSNTDDVGVFLAVEFSLGNPLTRFLINKLSKNNDGSSLLEKALMEYCGLKKSSFSEKLKIMPVSAVLGMSRSAFGVEKRPCKNISAILLPEEVF